MKARNLISAIGAVSILGIASLFAAPQQSNEDMTYTGKVMTVSPTAHTITVLHHGSTETFRIGRNSRLSTLRKPDARLKDFEFGDRVIVRYQDKAMGVTAATVHEEPAK